MSDVFPELSSASSSSPRMQPQVAKRTFPLEVPLRLNALCLAFYKDEEVSV